MVTFFLKDWERHIITIVICSIFLRFHPSFLSGVISVYAFDALILALMLFSIAGNRIKYNIYELIYIATSLSLFWLKAVFIGLDSDSLMAEMKMVYYVVTFCWLRSIIEKHDYYHHILKLIDFCFFTNAVVAIIQFLEIPVFASIIHLLYGEFGLRSLWSGYARVYGTFNNANWFALYLAIMMCVYTINYFKTNKTAKYVIRVALIVVLLLTSGSRSGLLATSVGLIACLLIGKKVKLALYIIFAVSLISVFATIFAESIPMYAKTFNRYSRYFDALYSANDSGQLAEIAGESRFEFWEKSWDIFSESILWGNQLNGFIPHNSYLAFLIRFGLISLVSFIPLIFCLIQIFNNKPQNIEIKQMSFASSFVLLFGMFSGDYLFTTQIMMVMVLLFSFIYNNLLTGSYYGQNYSFLSTAVPSNTRK